MSDIYKMRRLATAEWLFLDWHAQWLFYTIASKCDAQGVIALGRHGKPALAAIIGNTTWEAIEASFGALVRDGFVECADDRVVVTHFAEWQQCDPAVTSSKRSVSSEAKREAGRLGGIASGASRRAASSSRKPAPSASSTASSTSDGAAYSSTRARASESGSGSDPDQTHSAYAAHLPERESTHTHDTHARPPAPASDAPAPATQPAGTSKPVSAAPSSPKASSVKPSQQPQATQDVDANGIPASPNEAKILAHLRAFPAPICHLATVEYARQFACAIMSGASVGLIAEAITAASLKIGAHRNASPNDPNALDALANYIGGFIANQRRNRGNYKPAVTTHDPRVAQLRGLYGEHWSDAMGEDYTAPEHDLRAAGDIIAEADRAVAATGSTFTALAVASHWIKRYFDMADAWTVERAYPLTLVVKRIGVFGMPVAAKPIAAKSTQDVAMPPPPPPPPAFAPKPPPPEPTTPRDPRVRDMPRRRS